MLILEKPIGLKRYLTFSEVWEVYGIGRKTIAKYVRERQLRRRMVGKAWRYPVDDLERIFSADTRVSHGARRMRRGVNLTVN